MAGEKVSGDPQLLRQASQYFLGMSDRCEYMLSVPNVQAGGAYEYALMSLQTDKPKMENAIKEAVSTVVGVLMQARPQYADAWAALQYRAKNLEQAGG